MMPYIYTEPLTLAAFRPFGTVIEAPLSSSISTSTSNPQPQSANQGTALKYADISPLLNLYPPPSAADDDNGNPLSPRAQSHMNLFVCAPRRLMLLQSSTTRFSLPLQILEQHPFTTQTFVPLGLDDSISAYVVVVCPSSAPSDSLPTTTTPQRSPPDLSRLRAFSATGAQAVTYGVGVWHAPMIVVGQKAVAFVVVQFASGVAVEDCVEVEVGAVEAVEEDGEGEGKRSGREGWEIVI